MNLAQRMRLLEKLVTPRALDPDEVELWAKFFLLSREVLGFSDDDQVALDESRSAAVGFIRQCWARGAEPSYLALVDIAQEAILADPSLDQ